MGVLFWWLNHRLDEYTHHGESLTVPDFSGLTLRQVENRCEDKNLRYQVYDSVYYPQKSRHTVVQQKPAPNSKVKNNRTIYLTVNSAEAPKVPLPDLIEGSRRQAELKLKSLGLKVGELEYVQHPDEGAVQAMKVNGKKVAPGRKFRKGTTVNLVVGDGLIGEKTTIPPSLSSGYITFEEARFILQANNLTIGEVYDEGVTNRATAVVYRTEPPAKDVSEVPKGTPVNLFLRQYPKDRPDSQGDSPNELPTPSSGNDP